MSEPEFEIYTECKDGRRWIRFVSSGRCYPMTETAKPGAVEAAKRKIRKRQK